MSRPRLGVTMAVHIVALGGSLLRPEESARQAWLTRIGEVMQSSIDHGDKVGLVVGGGAPAREGISLAAAVIDDVALLDEIGISATRLNATIVRSTLAAAGIDVAAGIPHSIEEATAAISEHDVIVMGGTVPGHTTDAVAITLAIATNAASCIIATNVTHVFSADPRTDPNAVAYDSMTLAELAIITGPAEHKAAGASSVIDPIGVAAAQREKLALAVLDGRQPTILEAALAGRQFDGTRISPD